MPFKPEQLIPLSVPLISGNEWKYVKECLDTGWVSSVGRYVERFEADILRYSGTSHAVATVNGTAALHTALLVAGVQAGDAVILPTLTFIAPANAVKYIGAYPIFLDIEPDTWTLSPQAVQKFLDEHCYQQDGSYFTHQNNRHVRAMIPVHVLGHPVDMEPLLELGMTIIEDATESLGSTYKGRLTGGIGHIGCYSFNGNKIITTGGGGMIVTDNRTLAQAARYLTTQAKDDPLEYIHGSVGYNYRLTNVQAAIGCAQLEVLEDYIAKKAAIRARYNAAFSSIEGITPQHEAEWASSNHWLYTIRIKAEQFGMNRRDLLQYLADAKIQTRPLWQPLHRSPVFEDEILRLPCPIAEELYSEALSLPSTPNLSEAEQDYIINKILSKAP